ncbi:hypothetical protein ABZV60_11740 [Streptomyces sp. NPDC004787]|uniref:hypothetical protein n=1 Tax=Streptomyces sp. NPDC004787 TaxID=3154291 RepID=UPI0033A4BC11
MSPEGSPEGFASASASATGVVLARPDVSTLRTKQGAWIGVGGASFTVKGGSAFQVVSTLLTRADGSRSGRELVDEFPAGARPAVSRVLDALVARRCVAVLDAPLARQIEAKGPAAEWLLPHLAQLTDAPVRALDRLLATTLRLYGRPDWLDRLRGLLEAAPLSGPRTEFRALTASGPEPELPGDGAGEGTGYGLVVLDADGLPHERVVRLQDALLARGVPHGITGEVAGRRWILWSDDAAAGCWECLCRYGRTAPSAAPADEDAHAAALVQALYLRAAGLGGAAAAAVSLELAAGQPTVTDHPVWAGTAAAGCRCRRARERRNVTARPAPGGERDDAGEVLVRRNIVSPEDDGRLDDVHERIVGTLRGWTDEFAGPFRHLDGGDLTQVPFGQARVSALVGLGEACRVHELVAATLSPREAIYQAALNAVEHFASPGPPASPASPAPPASSVSTAVGAGWALEEAVYRALLKWSLARPPELSSWVRLTDDDLGHGECASFARYIQRAVDRRRDRDPDRENDGDRDREPVRWTGARLPNGVHRVTGRTAGGPVLRGAGVCYGEAVAMALLGLVNDDGALVPLNPHFRTWPEVWRQVARPEFAEVTERTVPFAHGKVRLVEVV